MFYAQIGTNGKVHTVNQSSNRIVEVEADDSRLLGTSYVNGAFIGYKIVLTTNKPSITADGADTATITATVHTWDDVIATT